MRRVRVDVQLPFEPRRHQRDAHGQRARFTVLVWHRRAGKTVFAILELLLAALDCKRERGRYAYVAPLLKQAKAVAWDYVKHYARCIPGVVVNESELAITLPNGASVRLFGADNPDGMRGIYLDGAVLDEVAQMKGEVWGEIVRPAIADRGGWVLFIGTPKGVNLFSQLYYRALDAENGGDDQWHADLRRWDDTGALPLQEIEQARREMTESQFAQEFECDFNAAVENALIALPGVKAAMEREAAAGDYLFAPRVLGVDVARAGGDRCALFPRQGLAAFRPQAFVPRNLVGAAVLMEVASRVAVAIDRWHPHATFLDSTGIGAGVADRLLQLGYQVVGVNFGSAAIDPRYENKRAEMWWSMADWIADGGCLPSMSELVAELTAPTYSYANARNRRQLESKDDIKERIGLSPDLADALALTFAQPVAIPDESEMLPGAQPGRAAGADFNPFAAGG